MSGTTNVKAAWRRGWTGGLALMLIGAALAIAGMLQTTSATSVSPGAIPAGSTRISTFARSNGSYVLDTPSASRAVRITDGTRDGGHWTSTTPISAIVVTSGTSSLVTSLSPAQTTGSFSSNGLPSPAISTVQFCVPTHPTTTTTKPVTTTKPPVTTTTKPPATTTTHPTVTTTKPPVTTTTPPSTTTTRPTTTTTTEAGVTTTKPAVTTTAKASTTTTGGVSDSSIIASTTTPALTTTTVGAVTSTTMIERATTGPDATLPRTGAESMPLVALGLFLFAVGTALTVVSVRRERSARS